MEGIEETKRIEEENKRIYEESIAKLDDMTEKLKLSPKSGSN